MTRHISTENLARLEAGDLRGMRARRARAHLDGCASCQSSVAALAELPTLLAAVPAPPMPASLAARIDLALAAEAASRAAATPSTQTALPQTALPQAGRSTAQHGARRPAGHRDRQRRIGLPVPAVRLLAAAAAVVVLGGGGYELVSSLGNGTNSTSSTSSASGSQLAPRAAAPHMSTFAGPDAGTPGALGRLVFGPAVQYRHAGHTATIRPVQTTTDYQTARLSRQVAATMAQISGTPGYRSSPGTQQTPGALNPNGRGAFPAQLAGCVSRIAAGRSVLLVNVARFDGAPATVIVTAAQGKSAAQIWVVGASCSASASDVLASQPLRAS
jgi:hypothetical protein